MTIDHARRDDLHRQLRASTARARTNSLIVSVLARRPNGASLRMLITETGLTAGQLRQSLDELVRTGAVERSGSPSEWHLISV